MGALVVCGPATLGDPGRPRRAHLSRGRTPDGFPLDRGVLAAVEALLAAYRSPVIEDLPPLHGGIVGYLGYDVVREVERLPGAPPDEAGYPDAILSVVGQLAAYDYWRQRVTLIESVPIPPATAGDPRRLRRLYDAAMGRLEALAAEGARPIDEPLFAPPDRDDELPEVRRRTPAELYTKAVEVAKEYILAGDIFQVVLSQRFELDLDADPFDLYRALRQVNPSPYMYFLRHPELCVVGSSPEPMVQLIEGGSSPDPSPAPAAGQERRPRPAPGRRADRAPQGAGGARHAGRPGPQRRRPRRRLRHRTGGRTDDPRALQPRDAPDVASVRSPATRGSGPIDVLRATLPAGTVSGAPKVRAMQIIDELEPAKRGPTPGVIGYFDFSGNLDTAIAIRTMLVAPDGTATVQAGAGIVADSDPADEDLECRNKAAALLAAVPGARRITEPPRRRRLTATRCGSTGTSSAPPGPSRAPSCRANSARTSWPSATGAEAWSWLLAPTGKVDALVRVTRLSTDDWLLDTDEGWGEAVLARLNRFKLRTKVEMGLRPWKVLGLREPSTSRRATQWPRASRSPWRPGRVWQVSTCWARTRRSPTACQ